MRRGDGALRRSGRCARRRGAQTRSHAALAWCAGPPRAFQATVQQLQLLLLQHHERGWSRQPVVLMRLPCRALAMVTSAPLELALSKGSTLYRNGSAAAVR